MSSLLEYIGIGLLGGLILNVMPCVLPVLTMKLFHVLEHGSSDARARKLHGVAYAAGILTAFLVLAVAIIVLRASGERVGWGMQFQHPPFVATMIALIFAFGLNALGVFEFNVSVHGHHHQGYTASYFNGIFAAVMSTPCSAPFLGTAAAFALGAGAIWWQTLAMFLAIGLGLASPFLLVSFIPSLAKALPRPGPWMETFKSLMGFTLLAAAIWLFGTLQAQVTQASSRDFLVFLLVLAIALWGTHHFGGVIYGNAQRFAVRLIALGVVLGAGTQTLSLEANKRETAAPTTAQSGKPAASAEHIAWTPFDLKLIGVETKRGRPVLADFTAEWCANCKTNDKLFVDTQPVRDRLRTSGILPMKADLTNNDDALWDEANALGRTGIPIYVLYLPDGTHDLLPEAITTDMLVAHIDAAAKKFPPERVARQ